MRRACSTKSATELGRRLGDWSLRNGGSASWKYEDLQFAYMKTGRSGLWDPRKHLVEEFIGGVKAMGGGRKIEREDICDPLEMETGMGKRESATGILLKSLD